MSQAVISLRANILAVVMIFLFNLAILTSLVIILRFVILLLGFLRNLIFQTLTQHQLSVGN